MKISDPILRLLLLIFLIGSLAAAGLGIYLNQQNYEVALLLLVFALLTVLSHLFLKRAQRKLQNQLSAQIGDAAPEAMLVTNDSGHITYANKRALALFGYAREEMMGQMVEILLPEQLRNEHTSARASYDHVPRQMGASRYLLARRKDGSEFPVEISLSSWRTGDRSQVIAMIVDITERRQIEDAMHRSEERWRFALEGSGDGVWDWDLQTGAVSLSRAGAAMFGFAENEMGSNISDWNARLSPEDRLLWEEELRKFFRSKTDRFSLEYRVRCKDGSYKWVLTRGMVVSRSSDGKVTRMIGVHTDINERRMVQETIRESEERFRETLNQAPSLIWVSDTGNMGIWYNQRWLEYTGRSMAQELGLGWLESMHPDDRERSADICQSAFNERIPFEMEFRLRRVDGSYGWIVDTGIPRFNPGGDFEGYIGYCWDISDRKFAEAELEASKERLRRGQMFANIGTWDWNIQTGGLYWTERIGPLFGYPEGELETSYENFIAAVHPDDRQAVIDAVASCVERDMPYEIEHRVVWPDGTVRWLLERGAVVRDGTGKPLQMLGVVQDIHERKMAQEALRESEARWSFAVEGAGDGIWDWDIRTGAMPLSGHYESMLGYQKGELEPTITAWVQSVHPDDLPRAQSNLEEYLDGKSDSYVIELRLRCKDGGYKWILCRGTVVERDAAGKPIRMIGIHTDIDRRKQDEQRLALFARIFDTSDRPIGVTDGEGRLAYVNHAHEAIFGYDEGEMIGMHVSALHPESESGTLGELWEATLSKGSWRGLLKSRRKDGSEVITSNSLGVIRDENGKPRFLFNLLYDYGPELEHQRELGMARDNAEAANRAKSEFLSSMSHELRTPLNAILGFSQLLESDAQLTEDQQDSIKEIIRAGNHLLELVNEVLDLAKIESGHIDLSLEPVAITELLRECRSLVKPLADQRQVTIEHEKFGDLHVRADRVRLKQVMLNLLSNAVKYNREGGVIKLEKQSGSSGYLRLAVIDTGKGIPADRIDELFQPFNRLDAEAGAVEGTGIGLTITRKLVEMMGGTIGVESTQGVGSTFWIELPMITNELDEVQKQAMEVSGTYEAMSHNAHTVLYIEDNPVNLKLVSQILARRPNIKLLAAHSPILGLDLAKAHIPDLILLDINMHGMDGYQVLRKLQEDEALSGIPVVAVTANALQRDIERGMRAGFTDYLTKPLDIEHFLKTVDDILIEYSGRKSGGE